MPEKKSCVAFWICRCHTLQHVNNQFASRPSLRQQLMDSTSAELHGIFFVLYQLIMNAENCHNSFIPQVLSSSKAGHIHSYLLKNCTRDVYP